LMDNLDLSIKWSCHGNTFMLEFWGNSVFFPDVMGKVYRGIKANRGSLLFSTIYFIYLIRLQELVHTTFVFLFSIFLYVAIGTIADFDENWKTAFLCDRFHILDGIDFKFDFLLHLLISCWKLNSDEDFLGYGCHGNEIRNFLIFFYFPQLGGEIMARGIVFWILYHFRLRGNKLAWHIWANGWSFYPYYHGNGNQECSSPLFCFYPKPSCTQSD